ncbi:MAG: hypothetical protein ABH816_01865 [Candidatus Levyibacteriota bacterium]
MLKIDEPLIILSAMVEAIERRPRPGTKTASILEYVEKGEPTRVIVEKTGVSASVVRTLRAHIFKSYLPKPQEEKTKSVWIQEISRAKGGQSVLVEPFAKMGMAPVEIVEAIAIKTGRVLSLPEVRNAMQKARIKGVLPKPNRTKAEENKFLAQCHKPKEEIKKRVRLWLELEELLTKKGAVAIPAGREDWLSYISFFEKRRELRQPLSKVFVVEGQSLEEVSSWDKQKLLKLADVLGNSVDEVNFVRDAPFLVCQILMFVAAFHENKLREFDLELESLSKFQLRNSIRICWAYMNKYPQLDNLTKVYQIIRKNIGF